MLTLLDIHIDKAYSWEHGIWETTAVDHPKTTNQHIENCKKDFPDENISEDILSVFFIPREYISIHIKIFKWATCFSKKKILQEQLKKKNQFNFSCKTPIQASQEISKKHPIGYYETTELSPRKV